MWRLLIALVPACSFTGSSSSLASSDGPVPGTEAGSQAQPEAGIVIDAPPGFTCFGAGGLFVGCVQLPQPAMLMLTDVDTDNDQRCVPTTQPNGPVVCMISSTAITVPAAVRVTGGKPLVLLATDSITIMGNGSIDVSSGKQGTGAGFDATACSAGTTAAQSDGFGAGGAGGSFKTKGGAGGHAANGTATGAGAGNNDVPDFVRGGCAGSAGAIASGAPGHGGGALYLLAANTVQVDGTLVANGAGGGGAIANGGGAGAGSGGLIGIMATTIKGGGGARMFANGGGGGGGGSGLGGLAGGDGSQTLSTQAMAGGGGINAGGGGGGGVNTTMAAPGQDGQGGGGGGGGATGFIYFHGTAMFNGQTSPPIASP